jgi:SAM-dependent methyltransferase
MEAGKLDAFAYASRKEPEFMNFPLFECLDCRLVYAAELPGSEALLRAYGDADYDSSEEAVCAARTYWGLLSADLPPSLSLAVDVGAGNGALLPFLRKAGFREALGFEPSSTAIESAPPETREMLVHGIFGRDSLPGKTPDLICVFQTLEHVDDPVGLLRLAHERLSESGQAAIAVHNRMAWINRLLGRRSPVIDLEHVQLFCPSSVEALFKKAGFETVRMRSYWNSYPLKYWVRLLPLGRSVRRAVLKALSFFGAGNIPVMFPTGNIFAVGRKRGGR